MRALIEQTQRREEPCTEEDGVHRSCECMRATNAPQLSVAVGGRSRGQREEQNPLAEALGHLDNGEFIFLPFRIILKTSMCLNIH